jgi:hypothetical protein
MEGGDGANKDTSGSGKADDGDTGKGDGLGRGKGDGSDRSLEDSACTPIFRRYCRRTGVPCILLLFPVPFGGQR